MHFIIALAALAGCSTTVGEACTTISDCKDDERCDHSIASTGICTKACIGDGDCPGGSLCDGSIGLCMTGCSDSSDCTDGLVCETAASNPFCTPRSANQGGGGSGTVTITLTK